MSRVAREVGAFVLKQGQAGVFALFIFAMLGISYYVPGIPRYDFMLITCVVMQVFMVLSKLETKNELIAICAFHGVGLMLELYKVSRGSWSYPEFAFTKISGVPLYSGFMYASVASYIMQAFRLFELEFQRMPKKSWALLGVGLIYLNFFTAKTFGDNRILIIFALVLLFLPRTVRFTAHEKRLSMPMVVVFGALGCVVWMGENLATYFGAWLYPHQLHGWELVEATKIVSWSMMVMVAFVIIWTWKERRDLVVANSNLNLQKSPSQ